MLSTLLPLCLLAAAPQDPATKDRGSRFEMLSLQHICSEHQGLEPPIWGTMLRYPTSSEGRHDLLFVGEPSHPFSSEQVQHVLQALNATDVEAGRLNLETLGASLVVFGEGTAVSKLKQQLDDASAVLTRPLQIEVCVWDATDRELSSAILGPNDYSQFVGKLTPLWRSVASTRSGNAVALARERWTRYVRDVNPEVAQKQSMSVPVTDEFGEGGRVVVRPHLLVGGDDIVLHVQFGLSQRRGVVRTVQIGMPGAADLEVPVLETAYGGCSGRVVNGGALAVSLRGSAASGGQIALTVRVTSRTPPNAQAPAGLGIFPCGALTSTALTQRPTLPSPHAATDEESQAQTDPVEGFGSIAEERLVQIVQTALGTAAESGVDIQAAGGYLFVRADQQVLTTVDAVMRGLEERLLRNVTVRHTGKLMPTEGEPAEPTDKNHPLLHELVVPTLLGREVSVARMLETNVVRDLAAAIAQEASILDPIVASLHQSCAPAATVGVGDRVVRPGRGTGGAPAPGGGGQDSG